MFDNIKWFHIYVATLILLLVLNGNSFFSSSKSNRNMSHLQDCWMCASMATRARISQRNTFELTERQKHVLPPEWMPFLDKLRLAVFLYTCNQIHSQPLELKYVCARNTIVRLFSYIQSSIYRILNTSLAWIFKKARGEELPRFLSLSDYHYFFSSCTHITLLAVRHFNLNRIYTASTSPKRTTKIVQLVQSLNRSTF